MTHEELAQRAASKIFEAWDGEGIALIQGEEIILRAIKKAVKQQIEKDEKVAESEYNRHKEDYGAAYWNVACTTIAAKIKEQKP